MGLLPEIAYIIVIAIYSYLITHKIPKRLYSFSNIVVAVGAIIFGLFFGVSLEEAGLSTGNIWSGIAYGAMVSVPIIAGVLAIATSKMFGVHFSKTPSEKYNRKAFLYELMFRVPFGTALSEELIFRGVLFALLLQQHSFMVALLVSSVVFGLWHIFPTLHTTKSHDPLIEYMDDKKRRNISASITAVAITTVAGAIFVVVNHLSGSVISSWMIHTSINAFAILGGYITLWIKHRSEKDIKTSK